MDRVEKIVNQQIKEALALELTKATIADTDPLSINIKSADLWVSTFNESLKAIEAAAKEGEPRIAKSIDLGRAY